MRRLEVAGLAEAPDAEGLLAHLDNVGVVAAEDKGFTTRETMHRKRLMMRSLSL